MSDDLLSFVTLKAKDAARMREFLTPMVQEICVGAKISPDKALSQIAFVLGAGWSFTLQRHGRIVASVGFAPGDLWYADARAYYSKWAYVAPHERSGPAFRLILDSIIDKVEDSGVPAFLHFFRDNPARGTPRIIADEGAIIPTGHVMAIRPKEKR